MAFMIQLFISTMCNKLGGACLSGRSHRLSGPEHRQGRPYRLKVVKGSYGSLPPDIGSLAMESKTGAKPGQTTDVVDVRKVPLEQLSENSDQFLRRVIPSS